MIKKTQVEEDPDEFKVSQVVYCTSKNTYVKISSVLPDQDLYNCFDTKLNKDGKPDQEGFDLERHELTKFINV